MPELMFAQLLWIGCTLQIVQAACTEQTADQPATTECKTNMCNVLIGGTGDENKYCSQCAKAAEAPINGVCKAISSDASGCALKSPNDGTCTQCGNGYFLYKGGCYGTGDTTGQKLCTTAATEGVCTVAATGYFVVPGAAKTDESVVACGDATTGVTIGGNKKYVGVADCTKCAAPSEIGGASGEATATCEACASTKIVKTDENGTTCIAEADCPTTNGYFLESGSPKNCKACAANCLTCTATTDDKCKSCAEGYFLGAANTATEGKCIKCDNVNDNSWKGVAGCTKCTRPNTSGASGTATCDECEAGKKPSEDKTKCNPCADTNCSFCDEQGACQKCSDGYTLEGGKCASSSANRSGLSTGAIAGISVAAVVVVGGLVGFLCWWFVCRGKA
ncbi:Variant-specific surface protein [Giardia duodenalis assemblage B]|uniref:Variant-specific surface protein n=1 Tax=Giardia duodenalis assemblage B TaxID=1394984 RepID=A0A132NR85_GIAIN|nr:Variant-specific surface protein [Giardia intestinalis assemblage B]